MKSSNSLVVEHSLSKRKAGGSIPSLSYFYLFINNILNIYFKTFCIFQMRNYVVIPCPIPKITPVNMVIIAPLISPHLS